MTNPWPYLGAAYTLTAAGVLSYLLGLRRRRRALTRALRALETP